MIVAVEPAPPRLLSSAARWLAPSLSDIVFGALMLWLVLFTINSDGTAGLLVDSGTGYHIRTGDFILQHKAVPYADPFSFSKPGQRWQAWEWLTELLFALLYGAAGMKPLIILAATIIALANLILLRHMLWQGANALVAIGVLHLVVGASSIHFLARPHIFTLLFLAISLWLIEADLRRPSARIWLLVPISVVWTNFHGGFLALLASLGVVTAGLALEGSWTTTRRYVLLGLACTAGTAVNPYGFLVHEHALKFFSQNWMVDLVQQEGQSPHFNSPESRYFEILLFAGVALAAWLISQKQIAQALLILAWGHEALGSTRHIPIYGFVVAPLLAREATRLWDRWAGAGRRGSTRTILGDLAVAHTSGLRRSSVWAPALVLALALFNFGWSWPTDFPAQRYPVAMATRNAELISSSRIFTTDSWADYLTFRFYPRQKIFIDSRNDFFWKEMAQQYLDVLKGQHGWEAVMKQYDFNAVLVPSASAISSLLRMRPDWQVVDDDGRSILFRRTH